LEQKFIASKPMHEVSYMSTGNETEKSSEICSEAS